jgi:hypothetical protein
MSTDLADIERPHSGVEGCFRAGFTKAEAGGYNCEGLFDVEQ